MVTILSSCPRNRQQATLALERVADRPAPRVLIGGLGMGFTLRAAQAVAPADARLIVSECVSACNFDP
jgi:spermidine synthase